MILSPSARASLPVMLALALLSGGCGGGSGGGGGEKTLTSVAITPAPVALAVGATLQLKANGTYSDTSTADLTAASTWASSNVSVATVSTGGLLTGIAAGTTTVTATSSGVAGTQVATVSGPTVVSITVRPATSDITRAGAAVPLTAMAVFSDSPTPVDVSSRATWTTSSAGQLVVSTGGSATAPSSAIVGATGTATASLGGKESSAALRVVRGPAYGPGTSTSNDPLTSEQWYIKNTGPNQKAFSDAGGTVGEDLRLSTAWELGLMGEGVKVAIVDDGLEIAHEDLNKNMVTGSWNFLLGTDNPSPTGSGDAHGTAVTGITAMVYGNSVGGMGVAPKVGLNGYNLTATGSSQDASMIEKSLGQSASNPMSNNVFVFNQSTGRDNNVSTFLGDTAENVYKAGVENLRSKLGAIYVKSAGNGFIQEVNDGFTSGENCTQANATGLTCVNANMDVRNSTPYNVVVGSLSAKGRKASYSTAGSALWISAPGGESGGNAAVSPALNPNTKPPSAWPPTQFEAAMVTTDRTGCVYGYARTAAPVDWTFSSFDRGVAPNTSCTYTNSFSGTSSAAPSLSGAIALLLDARPDLTWREVKHILAKTARKVDAGILPVTIKDMLDGDYVAERAWTENKAKFWFHNWYGFGAVDVSNALKEAQTFPGGSLGTLAITDWKPSAQTLNLGIPDNSAKGVSSTLSVADTLVVESVQIEVKLVHPRPGDLGLELTSPDGSTSILLNIRNGFIPATGVEMYFLSHLFYGESAAGNWTLKVVDGLTGERGTLDFWQLRIYGHKK